MGPRFRGLAPGDSRAPAGDAGTEAIVREFEAVGTSRPVGVTAKARALLLPVLELWMQNEAAPVPDDVLLLRHELADHSARQPGGNAASQATQLLSTHASRSARPRLVA